jgi:ABC-2 type transport system permease protein
MNKILLVIKREYLTRVRKKSFIVMTIAAPLLLVAFYGIIFYFALNRDIGDSEKRIYVVDNSGMFAPKLTSKKNIQFVTGTNKAIDKQKEFLESENYYGFLTIPDTSDKELLSHIKLVAVDQPSISTVDYIEDQIERVIKENKLTQIGIDEKVITDINKTRVSISTAKATDTGEETSSASASTAIGFSGALLIYLFIFLYGVQVMRGVIEEKTNRIVEVIISSIKPFQLMMGKIVGIALVGLTQFVIWVLLIAILGGGTSGIMASQMHLPAEASDALAQSGQHVAANSGNLDFLAALMGFNYVYIIAMFLFYFISGYLFYGALFAAIGSAVDNETDTQQFMFPVTLPLIFAFVLAQSAVVSNPNGPLAFWLSIIPFFAPVVMMVRIPFGVAPWEVAVSMVSMILGFIFTVWLAGRVYRIGILMYGKKPSYKEIGKWLFYKG